MIDSEKFGDFLEDDILVMFELKDKGLIGCGKELKDLSFGLECDRSQMFV